MAAALIKGDTLAVGRDQGGHQDQGPGAAAHAHDRHLSDAADPLDVPIALGRGDARTPIPTDRPEADGTLDLGRHDLGRGHGRVGDPALPTGIGLDLRPGRSRRGRRATCWPTWCVGRSAPWTSARTLGGDGREPCATPAVPGWSSMAISAVDTALWDLEARLLGLPLHRLLGARPRRRSRSTAAAASPPYARGPAARAARAAGSTQGIPRVKIKIGESWGSRRERDLERVRLVRQTVGPDVEVFVDANGGYDAEQAVRVGRRLDDLGRHLVRGAGQLRRPRRAATGARGRDAGRRRRASTATASPTSRTCCAAETVDCVQVDVTRCGGYTEWLPHRRARRGARPRGVGALRARTARAGGHGDAEPAAPGVVPRPRPHRGAVPRRLPDSPGRRDRSARLAGTRPGRPDPRPRGVPRRLTAMSPG